MADIESTTNSRIKGLVRLRKRRERDSTGLFLVEGERELESALLGHEVLDLYVCEDLLTDHGARVYRTIVEGGAVPITSVTPPVLEKISLRGNPSGFVAVLRQWEAPLSGIPTDEALVLVVESIEKPGNLGGMIRSANAAGASVVVADATTDLFNSNVIRASMGTLFTTPVAVASTTETLAWLDENEITVFATTPAATKAHSEVELTQPCALVVGSESTGLTDVWFGREQILIPMTGTIDSLNASVSAGIVLFEAVRQRRNK
ncbi:MAG: RNA methyltransferase [Acidimicrobiia bacterium]|nr:RNA methyltransferase [Acidimicrobiia bacterium]MBT8193137.1 RNA methyltransferase [Acidimicrobiia bacterium]NNL13812.1 RNA methyltransferase [Acidimicrobiia bacterium]